MLLFFGVGPAWWGDAYTGEALQTFALSFLVPFFSTMPGQLFGYLIVLSVAIGLFWLLWGVLTR